MNDPFLPLRQFNKSTNWLILKLDELTCSEASDEIIRLREYWLAQTNDHRVCAGIQQCALDKLLWIAIDKNEDESIVTTLFRELDLYCCFDSATKETIRVRYVRYLLDNDMYEKAKPIAAECVTEVRRVVTGLEASLRFYDSILIGDADPPSS